MDDSYKIDLYTELCIGEIVEYNDLSRLIESAIIKHGVSLSSDTLLAIDVSGNKATDCKTLIINYSGLPILTCRTSRELLKEFSKRCIYSHEMMAAIVNLSQRKKFRKFPVMAFETLFMLYDSCKRNDTTFVNVCHIDNLTPRKNCQLPYLTFTNGLEISTPFNYRSVKNKIWCAASCYVYFFASEMAILEQSHVKKIILENWHGRYVRENTQKVNKLLEGVNYRDFDFFKSAIHGRQYLADRSLFDKWHDIMFL
ncbi:hypothetical protein ACWOAH_04930 [Vagococcus vulneris]|uniref:Uncharacterized protein n=1 Tax=Vagococcus vulneris TaxID=1977869 RepID=A0A429ZZW3_9ENTE|nr:hypothetical protein [Vagococcus vulneris]RST99581.1 hypothetical protein CBF37_04435 [Vagococcus vulneris]